MKKLSLTLAKTLIFFIIWAILASVLPIPQTTNDAIWRFWAEVMPFVAIVGLTGVFWLMERRKLPLYLTSHPIKNILYGIGLGSVWIGVVIVLLMVTGKMTIGNQQPVTMLWLWLVSAFINTVMQELLVRGYLYQLWKNNYSWPIAVVISTGLFTLMHGGALGAGVIPVLNIVTMSLMMTVILEYSSSLMAPIMMHFIWNSVGGIILGSVSLADDYPHLYQTILTGNDLLSGGVLKMEGSLIVLLVNVLFIVYFGYFIQKQRT
ncbi:MAG: CPBP family intramembrane metalloprotease [Aerococcus suis]|nr:CPBP family intramembrane metalloprotease [Aerococcus suis]